MISKSEIIIANQLTDAGIVYAYEQPFTGRDGTRRYPDFMIEDADTGITWIWKHLEMLGDAGYDRKWAAKLDWYRASGVVLEAEGGSTNGNLLTTIEQSGIDQEQIARHIAAIQRGG